MRVFGNSRKSGGLLVCASVARPTAGRVRFPAPFTTTFFFTFTFHCPRCKHAVTARPPRSRPSEKIPSFPSNPPPPRVSSRRLRFTIFVHRSFRPDHVFVFSFPSLNNTPALRPRRSRKTSGRPTSPDGGETSARRERFA